MGKYHCTADLLFDRFGFNQTSKSASNSTATESKQIKQEVRLTSDNSPYEVSEYSLAGKKHDFL